MRAALEKHCIAASKPDGRRAPWTKPEVHCGKEQGSLAFVPLDKRISLSCWLNTLLPVIVTKNLEISSP